MVELFSWFSDSNRPPASKSVAAFGVSYSTNGMTWNLAIGLDISQQGATVLCQHGIAGDEADFRFALGAEAVTVRAAIVRREGAMHSGRHLHKYVLQFVRMAAADQRNLADWLRGGRTVPATNRAERPGAGEVLVANEDVARLFPKPLLDRLHTELVNRRRLMPLDPKLTPLVKYYYAGTTQTKDGRRLHRLTVESKVARGHHEARYRTRFTFDDAGTEITVLD